MRLRLLLSFLEAIRQQVKQRAFLPWHVSMIESLYQKKKGWRQARLSKLLRLFGAAVQPSAPDRELEESRSKQSEAPQQETEAQHQELLRLLDEEIAHVQEEFQYAEKVNEEKVSIERDACLAPAGEQWQMMLRREAALDRSIDRKVKILLAMRKEFPEPKLPPDLIDLDDEAENETFAPDLGSDIPFEVPLTQGVSPGDVAPLTAPDQGASSAGSHLEDRTPWKAGWRSPLQEKINERSANVIESKGFGCTTRQTIAVLGQQEGV